MAIFRGLGVRRSLELADQAWSLGVGVVQLNVALNILFGLPQGFPTQIGLTALAVIMATVSAVSGVDRGVRVLSTINVLLAIGLARGYRRAWVWAAGVAGPVGMLLSLALFIAVTASTAPAA